MSASSRQLVERAIEREPRLTYFGLGVYAEKRKQSADVDREFDLLRTQLLSPEGLAEVALCEQWLIEGQNLDDRGSYGLKHDVENWADAYISNGALIAAALGLGYEYVVSGPNVVLSVASTRTPHGPRLLSHLGR